MHRKSQVALTFKFRLHNHSCFWWVFTSQNLTVPSLVPCSARIPHASCTKGHFGFDNKDPDTLAAPHFSSFVLQIRVMLKPLRWLKMDSFHYIKTIQNLGPQMTALSFKASSQRCRTAASNTCCQPWHFSTVWHLLITDQCGAPVYEIAKLGFT